jgi:16S rRNA (cytosine967-C5)-methyltransferase
MLKRWEAQLNAGEAHLLALANNTPPGTAFRVNTLLTSVEEVLSGLKSKGVETKESRVATGAFVVDTGQAAPVIQAAQRGLIYIQDEASQLVSLLLKPGRGERVLDLCAAPGSKSSHIAVLAEDEASILAADRYAHRLNTLRETCLRLGVRSVDALALDATQELPLVGTAAVFDRVLVDAPCSGTGTLRGNPEIKWRFTADQLPQLADLQLKLLQTGGSAVAHGGRLVYSTCSIEPEENEVVVRWFLERTRGFEVIPPDAPNQLLTRDGFVRTLPHRDGTDGFFAAVLGRVR